MKQIRFKVHSICVFLMFLLMIPFGAFAQQGMVTGQVVDEKGESVIGATVQIKGTSDGTITDFDGNFSLKAKVGNTLVVSYVGYSTQEVKISKQTGNRIVLKEDAEVLDEVVVVGYGTARKGDLTGALTTMKPDANDAAKATSLDNLLSGMVAGSKYRGEFEERIKKVIAEVKNAGNVLLFLDEIHTIIGAGGAEGAIDASNILKPSLARGEIQLIGATTLEEYRKHIEKDAALERRFQPVKVEEPTEDEAIDILMGLRPKYEEHHNVVITDDAVRAAVKLSKRYINDRFLPDKAIDLIDEASSRTRLEAFVVPKDIKKLETQIDELSVKKEQAIKSEKYDEAAELKKQQTRKKNRLEKLRTSWQESIDGSDLTVDEEQIARTVSMWTKIPVAKIAEAESEKLMNLEKMLHNRVIGQDEADTAVAKAIRRGRVGLKDPNRPIGTFLILGPTGVGKTELSKALADCMFGTDNSLI